MNLGSIGEDWEKADRSGKQKLMEELAGRLPTPFEWRGMETFERWGRRTETGVFAYEGRKFVFVPGTRTTLGWNGTRLHSELRAELLEALEEYEIDDPERFLRGILSPEREAEVGPMLVECEPRQFSADVIEQEKAKGFRPPSENEWEYLFAAGSRSLFPWGDRFDHSLKLRHFEEETSTDAAYDLEQPNVFGIRFAGDPYICELTSDASAAGPLLRGKGGDGGSLICGGENALIGCLPATLIAYRDFEQEDRADVRDSLATYSVYRRVWEIATSRDDRAEKG